MKKWNLLFVFALAGAISTTALAFNLNADNTEVAQKFLQEKVEIPVSELPMGVSDFISNDFAGYTVEKAYKSEKDGATVYYVDLAKDGSVVTLLFDGDGNVIEE
ncbi:MAG: hypothetical protein OEM04_06435 [Flavobacteriaceae bacterium]|nr:hypothetical protein [Flavobacteriaceae bacterium]